MSTHDGWPTISEKEKAIFDDNNITLELRDQ